MHAAVPSPIEKVYNTGTILVFGGCDFPNFFNMAAHLNHTTKSCYHAIVELTNLTPVIQMQTFHQYKSCNSVLRQHGVAQLTTGTQTTTTSHVTISVFLLVKFR